MKGRVAMTLLTISECLTVDQGRGVPVYRINCHSIIRVNNGLTVQDQVSDAKGSASVYAYIAACLCNGFRDREQNLST